ncbi:MAG TPA: hypothetical protein DD827_06830 [Gammaproteobacteria bacterium]|nr:hypothetical protein [Gammaproteobacteria bacterium]
MTSFNFMEEYPTKLTGLSTAEDLLAGLITHQSELGNIGQQLTYILLGAGICPSGTTNGMLPQPATSQLRH